MFGINYQGLGFSRTLELVTDNGLCDVDIPHITPSRIPAPMMDMGRKLFSEFVKKHQTLTAQSADRVRHSPI